MTPALLRRRGNGPLAPYPWQPVVGQAIGTVLWYPTYRVRVVDADLVPRRGPVVFAANHSGWLDGPLVFTVAPRPASFIVKQEMFAGPLGPVLRGVGQIPIDRSYADRRALTTALAVLRRGRAVGVFPEGSRGRGDVAAVHSGVTWLAAQGRARVVPVACLGTRGRGGSPDVLPRVGTKVRVVFGAPLPVELEPGVPRRRALTDATARLRDALAAHVAQAVDRTGVPLPDDEAPSGDAPGREEVR